MNVNTATLDELFAVIKHNCKTFGGDKKTYELAFKARAAIKYGTAEAARRHGFAFAEHALTVADTTGVLYNFAAIVEHAHRKMAA